MALPLLQQMRDSIIQRHMNMLDGLENKYCFRFIALLTQKRMIRSEMQKSFVQHLNQIDDCIHKRKYVNSHPDITQIAPSPCLSTETPSTNEGKYSADTARKIRICPLCNAERSHWSISLWTKHLNHKHHWICQQCEFRTTTSSRLKRHIQSVHENKNETNTIRKSRRNRKRKFNEISIDEPYIAVNKANVSTRTITKKVAKKQRLSLCGRCKHPLSGNVIKCDNKVCKLGQYHFKCVKIVQKPAYKWYCKKCRRYATKSNTLALEFLNDQ